MEVWKGKRAETTKSKRDIMFSVGARLPKAESFFDESTGLERRRRMGGAFATPPKTVGTKREVWNGSAERTSGGLTMDKLGKNKRGHIVSVLKYLQGKQRIGQLAQSPFFGRVQDLGATNGGRSAGCGRKAPASPKNTGRAPQQSSYLDDISRLGGVGVTPVGFQPRAMPSPFQHPMPMPMPAPANNAYGYAQPPYPSMY